MAEEKFELTEQDRMYEVLRGRLGKGARLHLDNGQEIAGIAVAVTPNLVHIGEMVGKEFYDAVVPLEKISAMSWRARG